MTYSFLWARKVKEIGDEFLRNIKDDADGLDGKGTWTGIANNGDFSVTGDGVGDAVLLWTTIEAYSWAGFIVLTVISHFV